MELSVSEYNLKKIEYIDKGIAYIYKKPTPIKVVKAEFYNGKRVIKEALMQDDRIEDVTDFEFSHA